MGGVSQIPVATFTVISGTWSPITTNSDTFKIILKPRDLITWRYSTISGTENYFTFWDGAALAGELVTSSGTVIAWVWPYSNTTMELLQGK